MTKQANHLSVSETFDRFRHNTWREHKSCRSTYATAVLAYAEGLLTPLLMQPYATAMESPQASGPSGGMPLITEQFGVTMITLSQRDRVCLLWSWWGNRRNGIWSQGGTGHLWRYHHGSARARKAQRLIVPSQLLALRSLYSRLYSPLE